MGGGKLYKAKIVKVYKSDKTVKIHYVGRSDRYDVLSILSPRIEAWSTDNSLESSVVPTIGGELSPSEQGRGGVSYSDRIEKVVDKDHSALDLTSDGDLMQNSDISQSSLSELETFLDRSARRAADMNKLSDLNGGCGAGAAGTMDCRGDVEVGGGGEFMPVVGDEVQVQDKKD